VGQILRKGLRKKGYQIDVFDQYRGWMLNVLRAKNFGASSSKTAVNFSLWLNSTFSRLETRWIQSGIIKRTTDDILDKRSNLVQRFKGSDAVIHLAALAHADLPGFTEEDYRRINYDGAVNVFEAAKEAKTPRFVFASSVAVYGTHDFHALQIEQFPILETNRLPVSPDENIYGVLKNQFEDYLAENASASTKAVALRLDSPGHRVPYPEGLAASTSIENLVEGFDCVLRNKWNFNFEAFNLVDRELSWKRPIDVQKIIREHWPGVPNFTTGNAVPFSTDKLSSMFGYKPIPNGRYIDEQLLYGDYDWIKRLRRVTRELRSLTSPGDRLIVVDDCAWGPDVTTGRAAIPFIERDGQYWGPPPDDETAIQELERLRRTGAAFMVFGWPAFWWLDHYKGFIAHLKAKYPCVRENKRIVVFDLR